MNEYKRILIFQDISSVGHAGGLVAQPILSALSLEACLVPTAVLSTHTGGFGKPAVTDLTPMIPQVIRHYKEAGITFDAILSGYLTGMQQVEMVLDMKKALLKEGGLLIVDPAMADHGKLYKGLDEELVRGMKMLCEEADVILPNLTEACLLTGSPYPEKENYEGSLKRMEALTKIVKGTVVMTGIGRNEKENGVLYKTEQGICHFAHPQLERGFSGTGDAFAACFAGMLVKGESTENAVETAASFVLHCMIDTLEDPEHCYGIKFEPSLYLLTEKR